MILPAPLGAPCTDPLAEPLADARARVERLLCAAAALGTSLPAPPEQPDPRTCCGRGCHPCMFTYYFDALDAWHDQSRRCLDAAAQGGGAKALN